MLRGKAAATNMAEAPVQMVRGALLDALDVTPKDAKAAGPERSSSRPEQKKEHSEGPSRFSTW